MIRLRLPSFPSRLLRGLLLAACVSSAFAGSVHAQAPAASLIKNSNMETDADGDDWPDGWPRLKSDSSWEQEDGNRFIRLTSTKPGSTVMLYSEIEIPAGTEALELSWRQRITDLKPGKQSWFDARIMMEFMDGNRKKTSPSPKAPATRKNTDGWVEKKTAFIVPGNARILKFMPSLFQVETGTFDLDDVALTPIDPAPLRAAAEAAAAAKREKAAKDAEGRQKKAAAAYAKSGTILSNGDFEKPGKSGDWPADWPGLKENGSWEEEDGNRFLRMRSTRPDDTVLVFRSVPIPPDTRALELSWRWRISELKTGKLGWHDARIMMDVKDAAGEKLKPQPSAPYTRRNSKDGQWESRSVSFLVPEGGVALDFMPTLFNVKAGVVDLDDIVVKPTDPAPVIARQQERERERAKSYVPPEEPKKENWPKEIRVVGNKILDSSGAEVWLQGLNIPSLEWSVGGEQVLKSTLVAIDEWKSNVIRIPVKEEYWFGQAQSDGGKSYRELVDQMIVLAANRGAYVVLDLHRYRAPKPEFIDFWKDAATRYKNHPALIFDLMNEPHGTSWKVWRDGGFIGEKEDMEQAGFLSAEERAKLKGYESPGMQALLDAVRSTGATNVVLVGGLDYAYYLDGILEGYALEDKTGRGIIYATHVYPWKRGWQKRFLNAAAKHPILLGEVGADAKKMDFMPHEIQEDAETWVPDMLGLIQQHKLHWTGWCFHPKATPRMILDWDYTPTPFWGQQAKDALSGKQFPPPSRLR